MTRGSSDAAAPARPAPPAAERGVWLLLPGGRPVRAGSPGAAEATCWCEDGDGTRGLPWRPIAELGADANTNVDTKGGVR